MDLSFITNYFTPVVMAGCLVVGYVVKKWVKDVDNKYIPTIVAILGAVIDCAIHQSITIELIIAGAICGLASTGMHQAFTRIIENNEE